MEIRAINKFFSKGIFFEFRPYETLIPKLSMLAATPINNIVNHCISVPSIKYLWSMYMGEIKIVCLAPFSDELF